MFLRTPAALALYIKYDISACVVKLDRDRTFKQSISIIHLQCECCINVYTGDTDLCKDNQIYSESYLI